MGISAFGAFAAQACTGLTQDSGMTMMMATVTKDIWYMSKCNDSCNVYVCAMHL